jgi:hypothetical protein
MEWVTGILLLIVLLPLALVGGVLALMFVLLVISKVIKGLKK